MTVDRPIRSAAVNRAMAAVSTPGNRYVIQTLQLAPPCSGSMSMYETCIARPPGVGTMNRCSGPFRANGSMSGAGWTQASLRQFLEFVDSKGITRVDLWTGDALILVQSVAICDWFIDELRAWVRLSRASNPSCINQAPEFLGCPLTDCLWLQRHRSAVRSPASDLWVSTLATTRPVSP